MANTILLKRSAVPGKVPQLGDIPLGSVALNTADAKLYTRRSVNGVDSIVELGGGSGGHDYTFSATAPGLPDVGDDWVDSLTGSKYTYIYDGDGFTWAEFGPAVAGVVKAILPFADCGLVSQSVSCRADFGSTPEPLSARVTYGDMY